MPSPTLPSEAVLAELDKVLSSGVFRGASRSSTLLRFLVEETLAGNGDRLKDYTLGAVALGRGDDFDPRTDPIARVEASRLRSRLELYYATEGAADTVTISLPKGGYVPQFDQRDREHPTAQIEIPRRAATWAWVAAAVLAVIAVAEGLWLWRSAGATQPAPEVSLSINTPRTTDPVSLALSPDGKNLAFVAVSNGRSLLWLHELKSRSQRPLVGTDYASAPFWSPDNRSLGFFADGRLKRIDIDGGSVKPLARVVVAAGGAWNRDGVILFPLVPDSPLYRIPENGGKAPVPVTELKPPETGHRSPQFLPDGRHFLYYVMGSPEVRGIYVGDLEGGPSKRLFDAESPAAYAPSGYVFFVDQGTLFAQRFDPVRQDVSGNRFKVAEGIASEGRNGLPALSVSAAGLIAYRTGSGEKRQFVWFDRHGKELERLGERESFGPSYLSISPDYRRLAVQRTQRGNTGIWLIDLAQGQDLLFTTDPEPEIAPVWLPDSDRIVFSSRRTGLFDLYTKSVADPAGEAKQLLHTPEPKQVTDASRDGRFIAFRSVGQKTDWDIWGLATSGDQEPFRVVQTNAEERDGQFSPDGNWIAYQSNESGQFEIYMRPFRGPGEVIPISKGGGTHVRWAFDGRELFYVTLDGQLVSVPMRFSPDTNTWERGTPDTLFPIPIGPVQDYSRLYVVSKDRQRFLVDTLVEEDAEPIIVLLNWKPGS
jgi:Tol biopolymer transport system component